jgi:hypothetical protein
VKGTDNQCVLRGTVAEAVRAVICFPDGAPAVSMCILGPRPRNRICAGNQQNSDACHPERYNSWCCVRWLVGPRELNITRGQGLSNTLRLQELSLQKGIFKESLIDLHLGAKYSHHRARIILWCYMIRSSGEPPIAGTASGCLPRRRDRERMKALPVQNAAVRLCV